MPKVLHVAIDCLSQQQWFYLLSHAAKYGQLESVKLLVERAGPNISDESDWTPLFYAAKYSHIEAAEYVISQGHTEIKAHGVLPRDDKKDLCLIESAVENTKITGEAIKRTAENLEEPVYGFKRHKIAATCAMVAIN